jgi:hypothetical protein
MPRRGALQEHIPKPVDEAFIQEVRAWVEQPEEWDRERVYLADMGYVPEDTAGVPTCCAPCMLPMCTWPDSGLPACWSGDVVNKFTP